MNRLRPALLVGALVAVCSTGIAWAAASIDRAAGAPTRVAVRVDPPTPAIVIGDSAIAALRWVPGADNAIIGFEHTLDLESCRRLYVASCRGREGRTPLTAYEALGWHGRQYKILVVATGYNDGSSTMATSFQKIVERARRLGYQRIVWWTLRSDVDYVSPDSIGNHVTFAESNRIVRDLVASGAYPEVVIADWARYTAGKHEWFVTDGVHYRAVGTWAAADYLSRKMAFLERRACPMPVTPSASPQKPCPDPDVTGPIADIEALYPIGSDGVLCYEVGDDHRIECRLDTHVIQLQRELSLGMSGSDVSALQTRLQRLGLLIEVDGEFGEPTVTAVRSYQTTARLNVTGVADRTTLEALGFDVSAIPVSTTTTTTTTPNTATPNTPNANTPNATTVAG